LFVEQNVNKVISNSNEPSPIIIVNQKDDFPSPGLFYYGSQGSLFQGKDKPQSENDGPVEKILIGETYFDQYCLNNDLINKNKISSQIFQKHKVNAYTNQAMPNNSQQSHSHFKPNNEINNKFVDNRKENQIEIPQLNNLNNNVILSNNYYTNNNINNINIINPNNQNKFPFNVNNKNSNNFQQMQKMSNVNLFQQSNPSQYMQNVHQNLGQVHFDNSNNLGNSINANMYFDNQQAFPMNNIMNNNTKNNFRGGQNIQDYYNRDLAFPKNRQSGLNFNEMGNEELSNYCYILAKDQPGCRFLQKKIEDVPNFANDFIFPKVLARLNR
jgi:hypothetical protein